MAPTLQDHAVILQALMEHLASVRSQLRNVAASEVSDVDVLEAALRDPAIPADVKCRIAQYFQFLPGFHDSEAKTPSVITEEISNIRRKLESNAASGHGDVEAVIGTLLEYRKLEEKRGLRVFARGLSGAIAVLESGAQTIYAPSDYRGKVDDAVMNRILIEDAVGATLGAFNESKIVSVLSGVPVAVRTLVVGPTVGALSSSVVALVASPSATTIR
jgi:hypothetical protein